MKSVSMVLIMVASVAVSVSSAQGNPPEQSRVQKRVIRLDFNQTQGRFNTQFKACVGAGRANEGLRADGQQQLALVKKECDFKVIRIHGLLSDDMGVYSEDRKGDPQYNFQYIDVLYDYVLSIGMKPFVELGFMPSALARRSPKSWISGKTTSSWYGWRPSDESGW